MFEEWVSEEPNMLILTQAEASAVAHVLIGLIHSGDPTNARRVVDQLVIAIENWLIWADR